MPLPEPGTEAAAHSTRVTQAIGDEIRAAGGWIPFARYMELALYAPGLGYYMAGARKLGREGDFVTAPEMSTLFGATLAQQVAQLLDDGLDTVLEIGAGSGALAAALLEELERIGRLPARYHILELSPELRGRSRDAIAARVPHLTERVAWLNRLPPTFSGVVIGNEVLDAMPVNVVRVLASGIDEAGAVEAPEGFAWGWRPAQGEVLAQAAALALEPPYATEIALVAQGFVRTLAGVIERGAAIFIDYGFPRHEFYHPQRSEGTLMCHYRHHAHGDPFFLPGLQDITAHVDFSAIAHAAADGGLALFGYATQAQFLINCGITGLLARENPQDSSRYLPRAAEANRLLAPSEMGELFKVIALGKGIGVPLIGFSAGDRSHTL